MRSTEIAEAVFREGEQTMQERKPYEVFEHTANVGIVAFGHTLPELFIHAAQGMESLCKRQEIAEIEAGSKQTVSLSVLPSQRRGQEGRDTATFPDRGIL